MPSASFEIKSAQLPLVALLLKTPDLALVAQELLSQFGPTSDSPDFFDREPLVLDFSGLSADAVPPNLDALMDAVALCGLRPVAQRAVPAHWAPALATLALFEAPLQNSKSTQAAPAESSVATTAKAKDKAGDSSLQKKDTLVIDKPLRSGQKVYARGSDLIVLAMVNQGAEIAADGNIHVYAPLRGKAMAGARGNTAARIFSTCLEPELVSIAGIYRTSENPLAKDISGQPAQVRLSDDGQEHLIIEALRN